jgi:hypothetical protein
MEVQAGHIPGCINFRHDFTQLIIGRVGSHFWVVFFDRRRDLRRLNGNK